MISARRFLAGAPLLLMIPLVAAFGARASAQTVNAFDPSVRSAGMGFATAAVFWGPDPGHARNPALLAYQQGVGFLHERQTYEDLDIEGLFFGADRLAIGEWGVGLSVAGRPWEALGGTRFNFGSTECTGLEGESFGFFESRYDSRSFGIGVNALELLDHGLRALRLDLPPLYRFGDVALGTRRNSVRYFLGPDWCLEHIGLSGLGTAETTTRDRGYVIRLTPYNSVDFPGTFPVIARWLGGARLAGAYGRSTQNYDDAVLRFAGERDHLDRLSHKAWSARLETGFPPGWRGLLLRSLTPLVAIGAAGERVALRTSSAIGGEYLDRPEEKLSGWEFTIGNVITYRRGSVDQPFGQIHGRTEGWGLGLEIAGLGGLRYDWARVPLAATIGHAHRRGFAVHAEPIAAWRWARDMLARP